MGTTNAHRGFASDNHAAVHPDVLAAIAAVNEGHASSYGEDPHTAAVGELFREQFGSEAEAFLVFNGSGANVASLDTLTRGFESAICTDVAHMNVDECGAPERLAGTKLLTVATDHGKLTADAVGRWESRRGDDHFPQPRVVSITQATELGTVYAPDEVRAIAEATHERGMFLHVDGARLANAAASLELSLGAVTTELGVDVVSFGGTKNGLMFGEAVVFCRPGLGESFEFVRKQLGQLASKMRFVAAQFDALLAGDAWRRPAANANAMAARLAAAVEGLPGVTITQRVQANAVFVILPPEVADRLQERFFFYTWDEGTGEVRWMCSWDTTADDVDSFAAAVAEEVGAGRAAS
jgi:threonine aldolase